MPVLCTNEFLNLTCCYATKNPNNGGTSCAKMLSRLIWLRSFVLNPGWNVHWLHTFLLLSQEAWTLFIQQSHSLLVETHHIVHVRRILTSWKYFNGLRRVLVFYAKHINNTTWGFRHIHENDVMNAIALISALNVFGSQCWTSYSETVISSLLSTDKFL